MPFTLIPPGKRGNRVWYTRIHVQGRAHEISTNETDEKRARSFAREAERRLYISAAPRQLRTVGEMIEAYIAFRRPRPADEAYLLALSDVIGRKTEITQADADEAAQRLYPHSSAATWNRQVYTPLLAALNHHGIRPRIRRPRIEKPANRAVAIEIREGLLRAAKDMDLRRLLLVLFYTGARIGEASRLTWADVDLAGDRIRLGVTKTREHGWRALHPRLKKNLQSVREKDRRGRVFRWQTRFGHRKVLAKLLEATGIKFHPHQARHTFATLLVDAGASLRDVMDAGGWGSIQSVARYVGSNTARVKKIVSKL